CLSPFDHSCLERTELSEIHAAAHREKPERWLEKSCSCERRVGRLWLRVRDCGKQHGCGCVLGCAASGDRNDSFWLRICCHQTARHRPQGSRGVRARKVGVRLRVRAAMRTDVGVVRDSNEDVAHVDARGRYAILADGMGGPGAGEIAAATTV